MLLESIVKEHIDDCSALIDEIVSLKTDIIDLNVLPSDITLEDLDSIRKIKGVR